MKNSNRFFSKALMSLILAGLCLCFVTSVSKAQCPTDVFPVTSSDPGYAPWYNAGPSTIVVGSGCQIDVYYCMRMLTDGTFQFYIYKVVPTIGCDGLSPDQLIQAAQDGVYAAFVLNGSYLCGFGNYVVQSVFRASCWKLASSKPGDPPPPPGFYLNGFVPCNFPGSSSYCAKKCKLCLDAATGKPVVSDCTYTVYGTTPDCFPLGADGPIWVVDHCYILNCGL